MIVTIKYTGKTYALPNMTIGQLRRYGFKTPSGLWYAYRDVYVVNTH